MKRCVAITLVLLAGGQTANAQDAIQALERAERAYHALRSLEADFAQTIINPMLGRPEHARGTLYLAPPQQFAMRFHEPEGDRIVVDGTWLWTYAPSSVPDQVIKQPVPQGGTTTPNLMAQFVDRPLERYHATAVKTDTLHGRIVDLVRLVPKGETVGFTEATIAIGRDDGLLWQIALREESGQRRVLNFERIRTNTPIPRQEFTFVVPKGTLVVTP